MAKDIQKITVVRNEYQLSRKPSTKKLESGNFVRKTATAIFDSSKLDSSGVANSAIGSHGLGVYIPANAIITRAFYDLQTDFDSAAHTATVAVTAQTAGDIKAATLVSDATLSTTGPQTGIQDGTVANMVKTTAERELVVAVAVQTLTAGKLTLFVEYQISA